MPEQDSEIGAVAPATQGATLVTTTTFLDDGEVRVTNARGNMTETRFLSFDKPSTDMPVEIRHPEGAITLISRDAFGLPLTLTRKSSTVAAETATRTYTYDSYRRLCRTVDPETGATLTGWDDNGNPLWSASGLPSSSPCDESGMAATTIARKAARTYDARNRVTALTFAGGLGNQAWTYTADGLPATITPTTV